MIFSHDEWPGGHNIACSPIIWRRIFDTWGDAVGMNDDPSHLVWKLIDAARLVREFGAHMVHVHAKDQMIDLDGLHDHGILSAGMGWQVPRMPGPGPADWPGFHAGFYRAGHDGPVGIEHENRSSEGSDAATKRGFWIEAVGCAFGEMALFREPPQFEGSPAPSGRSSSPRPGPAWLSATIAAIVQGHRQSQIDDLRPWSRAATV